MKTALLIFPHQLFDDHPGLAEKPDVICILEEPLFFGDPAYPARFHKQKLAYHRTTITHYKARLETRWEDVRHVEYRAESDFLDVEINRLAKEGCERIVVCDVADFILSKRLDQATARTNTSLDILDTPAFINTVELNRDYRASRKRWFMADFYKWQRRRLKIMVDDQQNPEGGKWSFDEENRKKVPKKLLSTLPAVLSRPATETDDRSEKWVNNNFPDNPGNLDRLIYPVTHDQAEDWLHTFLEQRFVDFGPYEDAVVEGESWLWHSVLTPMLNIGLLTPRQVINETLKYAKQNDIPINSREGFIRQIIGWREFMRATYDDLGVKMRTTNHWQHTRKIPRCFYTAKTDILPIDDTIRRLNDTAYCHHIERLMVLGGFMFLCEIDPDDIYRWFMEMFIDSYDWVMVSNVYAMSQNADGGLITTKPYFSGSAYVKKMSHHKHDDWADIWDGLYWRFIWKHRQELAKNPRWSMMCAQVNKMDAEKRDLHLENAESYLSSLK